MNELCLFILIWQDSSVYMSKYVGFISIQFNYNTDYILVIAQCSIYYYKKNQMEMPKNLALLSITPKLV